LSPPAPRYPSTSPGSCGAQARANAARLSAVAARREADRTAALSAEAAEAIESPLSHPLGEATTAYQSFLVHSGLWLSDPKSALARSLLLELMGPSGVGAQVQKDAIAAYLAGDPAALAAGGVDRLPDGTTVTRRPGRPSIVGRPRLSGAQAQAIMDAVPAPAPDMGRVSALTAHDGIIPGPGPGR